ncbi:DotG/IcmE/VirB10 family protein [Pinisolibacter aquiterrae]|uniref:DotG/IcmE/VirB10 family protein n=1 Tax=Pinisolibacter aquiterrae TaxID=2815579 RepID=UPI001C3C3D07|nr:DotG/IcmE/VirB10 family protein [Pinisolibacter aquiterrae]MBV5266397.1 DotG/IcmE/VirB10 family protein [Pinisolibacter aquiterrae]MCC8235815.1 DotG/IcmE/VirB10 family protein [Pinisolibacter aquiterrae]
MNKYLVIGGLVGTLSVGTAGILLIPKKSTDLGGTTNSELRGTPPNPQNEPMKAVGPKEADRRAAVNGEQARAAADKGQSYVSKPVISRSSNAELGEMPERPVAPVPAPLPPPQPQIVYVQVPVQPEPKPDQSQVAAINSQIQALLTPPTGQFTVRTYQKGERPKPTAAVQPVRVRMVARAGDVATATLDRGFNSDDPAAPIFATIQDIDEYGRPGPLHDVRMMGKITYTNEQGAIEFDQAVLQDGRSLKLKAVAITSGTGRTGIATDVDHHYLERYGSLAFGGLVQGVGQVGQMLVAQNSTTTSTASSTTTSGNSVNWGQAAMGATLPLGQALTAAASQNFSRKNTMSADGQTMIGVLFLEPVTVQ